MKHWKSPDHFFEDRNVGEEMNRLLDELGFETASVTAASAKRIAGIHEVWGKGIHPASLISATVSPEVTRERAAPLLYVGDDFSKTDLKSTL